MKNDENRLKEEVFFPVEKVTSQSIGIEGLKLNSPITHAVVGAGRVLNFCSEGYGLVTNSEIRETFSKFLAEKKLKFEMTAKGWKYTRFQLGFKLTDFPMDIIKGDVVYPYLQVLNSYDGTQKYQVKVQVLREVCTNGLTALVNEATLKFLHTQQMENGYGLSATTDAIDTFLDNYNDISDVFKELSDYKVSNLEDRIRETVEETAFPSHLVDLAIERAEFEMEKYSIPPSDWLVYNSMNYQLNHHADNLLGKRSVKIDKEVLSHLLNF